MRFARSYISDLASVAKSPAAFLNWAVATPVAAVLVALLAGAIIAAVPLSGGILERQDARMEADTGQRLAQEEAAVEKDLLKGVSPTITRKSGLLGLGTRQEANPAFAQKKAEARRIAEEKKAEAMAELAALQERRRRWIRALWWGAGGAIVLLLLALVPSVAAAGRSGGGRRARAAGETVELPAVEKDSAIGPEGRYLLREAIGRGAMGVVYRAWDRSLEREVAVKEMPKPLAGDTEGYQRFRREALTLARLSHPNIVQVYDLFEKDGRAFLAMEYMGGGTLSQFVETGGRLDLRQLAFHAGAVFDALAYLHGQGVIHRDLKPGNILLTDRKTPKISDFGLARWDRQNDLTRDGSLLGSPAYMSPEQVTGRKADRRSDLYSFGALLYWMAAGVPPFTGEVEAVMAMHLTRLPAPPSTRNPKVPRQLDSLIMSLLAKDPADREGEVDKIRKILASLGGAR
jgi:hypothetical protein